MCIKRRRRRRRSYCCMGFKYVGMWVFHNTIGTQMEGGKSDLNPTHPISKWATSEFMVVLI